MGLINTVRTAAQAVVGRVNDAYAAGADAAQAILTDIQAASADLAALGYRQTGLEVQVGIPPGVTVFLARDGQPTDAAFAAALDRHTGRAARTLIQLVRQADHWAVKLEVGGRRCTQLAVDLGLRPAVRLLYAPPDGGAPPPTAGPG